MNDADYADTREDLRAMVASTVTLDHLEEWASLHDPHFHVGKTMEGCYCPVAQFMMDLFPKPAYALHSAAKNTPGCHVGTDEQCSVLLECRVVEGDQSTLMPLRVDVPDGRVACVIDCVDDLYMYGWSPVGPNGRVLGSIDAGMLYAMCRAVRRTYQGSREDCATLIRHEFEERGHETD